MKRVRKEKWPVFPRNWAEYGKILRNTGMQEGTDKKSFEYGHFSRSVAKPFLPSIKFFYV